jgi:hypothetical protein
VKGILITVPAALVLRLLPDYRCKVTQRPQGFPEAVYLVDGSVLSLSFVEPHTRDRPRMPDEPAPRDTPKNRKDVKRQA